MSKPRASFVVLAAVIASLAACSKSAKTSGSAPLAKSRAFTDSSATLKGKQGQAPMAVAAHAGEKDVGGRLSTGAVPEGTPRKLIQTGELRLTVEAYEAARMAIDALLAEVKGFIASVEVRHVSERVSSATLVLRIPAGRYGDVVARIAKLGQVDHEASKADDITEQYFDLAARLSNAKKLEARLLELLAKETGKITDVLQVERELARVREEIERFEGKLRLWDGLVSLSTLTVRLDTRARYAPVAPRDLGDDLSGELDDSWRSFKRFGRDVLRFCVRSLPWLPIWAAIGFFAWWLWRRIKRAFAKKPAAPKE